MGGGSEAGLADAEKEEATGETEEVTMTEIATMAATETGTETETGALVANDSSNPAQLRWVVRGDHCGAGHGVPT